MVLVPFEVSWLSTGYLIRLRGSVALYFTAILSQTIKLPFLTHVHCVISMKDIPRIQSISNGKYHLLVYNKPLFMRAAELNNPSLSSASYMKNMCPRMIETNVNTVHGPVSGESIEPEE